MVWVHRVHVFKIIAQKLFLKTVQQKIAGNNKNSKQMRKYERKGEKKIKKIHHHIYVGVSLSLFAFLPSQQPTT